MQPQLKLALKKKKNSVLDFKNRNLSCRIRTKEIVWSMKFINNMTQEKKKRRLKKKLKT